MGIGSKNCEEYTPLREMFGRELMMFSPAEATAALDDEFPVDASAVGTAITLTASPFYMPGFGVCVSFTDGAVTLDGASSATFQIVGFNQFGERVVEDVTITNAVATQSLNALRKVLSVTLTAKTGVGAGGTVDVGWAPYAASRRMALPFKVKKTTDVAALIGNTGIVTLNPTVSAVYHTITLPTTGFNAGIGLPFMVYFADHAQLKY